MNLNAEEKPRQVKGMRSRLASMTNRELLVWDHVLSHIVCIDDEFLTLGIGEPPSPSVLPLIRELRLEFKRRTSAKGAEKGESSHDNNNGTH